MLETQRKRRGHAFVPGLDVEVPRLYATEGTKMDDKTIVIHYFCAAGDWYIAEADFDSGEAFGYASLAVCPEGAEWGYIDLAELETLNVHRGLVIVERDLHFQPTRFADIPEAAR
jgi:hypothetical protein